MSTRSRASGPAKAPYPSLRIGILGCARIARQFARDVAGNSMARVVAIASRTADTAAVFAAEFGVERHYGNYESLLDDAGVDAVYVPLPNSLHAAWAIKAAQARKHVLCEKPMALSLDEARSMFEASRRHRVIMLESFPWYFQPQTRDMLALLHGGAIGDVRSVQASFGFMLADPLGNNIRTKPELGGGALLDAGSYPLSLIRLAMGCAPCSVVADATWSASGVDISMMGTLYYADGRRAQLSCAMDTGTHRRGVIVGSNGTIETEYLNHTATSADGAPANYLPSQLRVRRGTASSIPFEELHSSPGSGFRFAAEAFSRLVGEADFDACDRAAQASLDNSATLEALARSAREGRRVEVAPSRA